MLYFRRAVLVVNAKKLSFVLEEIPNDFHSVKESAETVRTYASWLKTDEGKNLIQQAGFTPIN